MEVIASASGIGGGGWMAPAFDHDNVSERGAWAPDDITSPHLAQLGGLPVCMPGRALPLLLDPRAPASVYRRRQDEDKTVVHWGQRKLLVSELTFLTMMGCAPSSHDLIRSAAALADRRTAAGAAAHSVTVGALADAVSAVIALGDDSKATAPACCPRSSSGVEAEAAWFVYAGAAPGTHVPILASLFPHVRFMLFDPAPFKCG